MFGWFSRWFLRWHRTYRLEYAGEIKPMVKLYRDNLYDVTAASDGLPNGGEVRICHGATVVATVLNCLPGPMYVTALWASDDTSQFRAEVYAWVEA